MILPQGHLVPDDARFHEGPDDGGCRVIRSSGERCRGRRMRAYGVCAGHAGRSGVALDPVGNADKAHASQRAMGERRRLLKIGPVRTATPRQLARLRAQQRAEEIAYTLVDAILDDPTIDSYQRQQAVLRTLKLIYPQA